MGNSEKQRALKDISLSLVSDNNLLMSERKKNLQRLEDFFHQSKLSVKIMNL